MADTLTPVYEFTRPEVGGSDDTWGTKLNDDLTKLDGLLAQAFSGGTPTDIGTLAPSRFPDAIGKDLVIQSEFPDIRLYDTTYTPPEGMVRLRNNAQKLSIQKATAADFTSFTNLVQIDYSLGHMDILTDLEVDGEAVFEDVAAFNAAMTVRAPITITNAVPLGTSVFTVPQTDVSGSVNVRRDLLGTAVHGNPSGIRMRFSGVTTGGLELSQADGDWMYLQAATNTIQGSNDLRLLYENVVQNFNAAALWPSFTVRSGGTLGASIMLGPSTSADQNWALSYRGSSNANSLQLRWQNNIRMDFASGGAVEIPGTLTVGGLVGPVNASQLVDDNNARNWVRAQIIKMYPGGVGSTCLLARTNSNTSIAAGQTFPGSNLRYLSLYTGSSTDSTAPETTNPSGTWAAAQPVTGRSSQESATQFVRIA